VANLMRKSFLLLTLLFSAAACRADYFPLWQKQRPMPAGLVLIYQGGVQRPRWTVSRFAPYVTWRDEKTGKEQWLFDGFLFIEFQDGRGHTYEKDSKLKHAGKAQWLWLLQRNFARDDGIPNLEKACEQATQRIGPPVRRRQVVITLPVPALDQTNWGDMQGRPLDFHHQPDRLAACQWYLDTALKMWRDLAPADLDLAGFYWVAERVPDTNGLFPELSQLVHARGKEFFWVPCWQYNPRLADWHSFGFDEACLQPNYFFHPGLPVSRIQTVCQFARAHGLGLEMEFDDRMLSQPAIFEPRFHAYLNAFIQYGVNGRAAMAWYEGGGALYHLSVSDNPKMRDDYDELCQFVLKRQHLADERFAESH
jgi:hypothetical protein